MRLILASVLLLAACGRTTPAANNQAAEELDRGQ